MSYTKGISFFQRFFLEMIQ